MATHPMLCSVISMSVLLVGCFGTVEDGPIPAQNEVAMKPMSRITATTPAGTIAITAGKGLKRSYTWDGATRSVDMAPRPTRWRGSLGIAWGGFGNHWKNHNGITRGVLEDGQQHFDTEADAIGWLERRGSWHPFVWRNDGLVVGWRKIPLRRQLNVEVWQLYIAGEKPKSLPNSHDDSITVDELAE